MTDGGRIFPADAGFRMMPEWAKQEAVWLSFPHNPETWSDRPDRMEHVLSAYSRFAAIVTKYENLYVNTGAAVPEDILERIANAGGNMENVRLFSFMTNDVWCRDHGPVFLKNPLTGERAAADFCYNAWGGKFPPWDQDNAIPQKITEALDIRRFEIPMVCEGGALEINNCGDLLTTESVILNSNRNPGMTKEHAEDLLKKSLGAASVLWLESGMVGDDTDGHIDTLARFAGCDDVILAAAAEKSDTKNYDALERNRKKLEQMYSGTGKRFTVVPVSIPKTIYPENWREEVLPATYVNYLLVNDAVIVPTYRDDQADRNACEIIAQAFPDRTLETVDCFDIILEGGALHCLSQQMIL